MNFISKHIHIIGLLLLTSFAATAAAMYWNLPARLSGKQTPVAASSFVCPMHPEVLSKSPGDCPKCGMALVSSAVSSASPTGCSHHDAAAQTAETGAPAAMEHAGCNHTQGGGGCCGVQLQLTTNALPSGCTRNLYSEPGGSSH